MASDDAHASAIIVARTIRFTSEPPGVVDCNGNSLENSDAMRKIQCVPCKQATVSDGSGIIRIVRVTNFL